VSDDDDDPPRSGPNADAPPDSAPPEPVAGPPLNKEERARRNAIIANAPLREALLKTLDRSGAKHRDDILNEGLMDALAAEGFPEDEGSAVFDFVANKINNARGRYFYRLNRDGKHQPLESRRNDAPMGGATAKDRLDDVLEVADRLAAGSAAAAKGLALLKAKNLEGLTYAEAAEREKLTKDAAYKTIDRFKKALRAALVVLVAVIGWSVAMHYRAALRKPNLTGLGPDHSPPAPVAPPAPDPADVAAPLVAEGLAACDRKEWRLCLEKLQQAGEIDTEIYRDGRVQDAFRIANEAIAAEDSKSNGKGDKAPAPPAPKTPQKAP